MAYLRYAIGKILLVMIGILLALQVNNWNELRKQAVIEAEFIEGVQKDLTQDKQYIELVLKQMEPKIEAFYPVYGSFQFAISGSVINNYKNKEISGSIIKLYNSTYSRLIDNGKTLDDRWDYLRRKYIHKYRTGNFRISEKSKFTEIMDDLYYHYLMLQ